MICIQKTDRTLNGEIRLPASKSISNRLLVLQYLHGKSLSVSNLSTSDDTLLLSSLLELLHVHQQKPHSGLLRLDVRNAGTVMRFLLPVLAFTSGQFLLTGDDRMQYRPVKGLVDALKDTGVIIDYLNKPGFLPLIIRGRPLAPGRIILDSSASSQYVSALLLAATALEEGLTIEITGKKVSWPYVQMTLKLLEYLGFQVVAQESALRVTGKKQLKLTVSVEPDWSAAAFWYCMTSMADSGEVTFPGLCRSGFQGDAILPEFFSLLGVMTFDEGLLIRIRKTGFDKVPVHFDFTDYPDLALPVILACSSAGVEGTFRGLDHLRLKESDRLQALISGLALAGVRLIEESPGIWKNTGALAEACDLYPEDFSDHRVAMTMACLAIKGFRVHIKHPEAVSKSYPGFWNDMLKMGFNCKE